MGRLYTLLLFFLFFPTAVSMQAQNDRTQAVIIHDEDTSTFSHTVEKGQTVYAIATMYGVKPEDIYRLNPGSEEGIRAGSTLRIPQRKATYNAGGGKDEHYIFHTIRPKETLYALSKRYGIPATAIVGANPGLSTSTFRIGKTIRIPTEAGSGERQPEETKQPVTEEIEYTIRKKETIYSICRKFDIPAYELLKRNPQLKDGAKAGAVIYIPVHAGRSDLPQSGAEAPLGERETNALLSQSRRNEPVGCVKAALLLPFMEDEPEPSSETKRFIEYYEGILLAVDSLRNSGCSVELSVYDTGKGTKTLKTILKEETALQQVHLLIGAVQNDQIRLLADFAGQYHIPYVIPFTSKNDDVLSNAYVYQVNTPHSYLYAKAAQAGCDLFADDRIILLDMNEGKDNKTEFIRTFKAEMAQRNIPYREINYNAETLVADIEAVLQADKRNVVVPTSGTLNTLNKIKSPIRMLAEKRPECGLTLFGYPEWQTYTRECLEDFHALNTYIYTNFYANNLSDEVDDFYTRYKNWFSKSLINIFPKYGILGFDTGMFFMGAIHKYGHFGNDPDQIRYKGIQTEFDFHRVNNWGGFINTNIFIVHYQTDFNVTRSEVR